MAGILIPRKNTRAGQSKERADKEAADRRFRQRKSWFITEQMRQRANRYQMALDESYYDGDQWTPDEAAAVRARGQNPVVFNECKPLGDFLIGTERRTRTDFSVVSRSDDSDEAHQEALAKTSLLKFVDDLNRASFVRSDAADDQFKAGLGWVEVGVRPDPVDYPIYKRNESWRNMLHDSLGQSRMPSEWRYVFRYREIDFDIAEVMVPPSKVDLLRKAIINADTRQYMDYWNGQPLTGMQSVTDLALTGKWTTYDADAWLNNPRERVMLIECWATEPYRDPRDGDAENLIDFPTLRKRVAIMTEHDTLMESWSPYSHDMYPFIPYWCYRRKKDGMPYGVIRQHRGPQDSLNKHMSKAQFRISTRQVWMEDGALDPEVMDEDEFEDEVGDPSAILKFARGALSGKKVEVKEGVQLAQADIQLAEQFRASIRNSSGVSTEDRGQDPHSVSGKARAIREAQGSKLTAEPFDHMLLARQLEGEITLSLVEQYHDQPMVFADIGSGRKRATYIRANQPDPQNPGRKINDIQGRKHAFVIGETPWQQSLAEAAFESMLEVLGQLGSVAPQPVLAILDIVFEMHPTLPKRDEIVKRIRQVNGQDDPDQGETPESRQRKMDQQRLAQAQLEAQIEGLRADVAEAKARGEKLTAEAMKARLEALYVAAQGAGALLQAPGATPVADELLRSAGYQDAGATGSVIDPAAMPAQPAQPAAPIDSTPMPTPAGAPPPLQGDGEAAGIETPSLGDNATNQGA